MAERPLRRRRVEPEPGRVVEPEPGPVVEPEPGPVVEPDPGPVVEPDAPSPFSSASLILPPWLPQRALNIEETWSAVQIVIHAPLWLRYLALKEMEQTALGQGPLFWDCVEFLFCVPCVEDSEEEEVEASVLVDLVPQLLVTEFRKVVDGMLSIPPPLLTAPVFQLLLALRDIQARVPERLDLYED
jgi:hypothetical protein